MPLLNFLHFLTPGDVLVGGVGAIKSSEFHYYDSVHIAYRIC